MTGKSGTVTKILEDLPSSRTRGPLARLFTSGNQQSDHQDRNNDRVHARAWLARAVTGIDSTPAQCDFNRDGVYLYTNKALTETQGKKSERLWGRYERYVLWAECPREIIQNTGPLGSGRRSQTGKALDAIAHRTFDTIANDGGYIRPGGLEKIGLKNR